MRRNSEIFCLTQGAHGLDFDLADPIDKIKECEMDRASMAREHRTPE